MKLRATHWLILAAVLPFGISLAGQTPEQPPCEKVYKDIQVFKGVPANDLIPSMQFMSASLHTTCTSCHVPNDYSASTRPKDMARKMIQMQRDINDKWFNKRLEVTCMSCHNGNEQPTAIPVPTNVTVRHERIATEVAPKSLFDKHIVAAGPAPASLTLTGTMDSPNEETNKSERNPVELIQASDGRFRLVSASKKFGFDGKKVWYGTFALADEPAAGLGRIGRTWRGTNAFDGLERTTISGKEKNALVVRASRPSTASTEELYFDGKSNLLTRFTNIKRSSLGLVVSTIDYSDFKSVGKTRIPMKIVASFANGDTWTMKFTSAKVDAKANDGVFEPGKPGG